MKKQCITCKKYFYKKLTDSKRYWKIKKYCSIKCSKTWFNKTGRYEQCNYCHKKVWVIPSRISKYGKYFCSRECADKVVGKLHTGYKHTEKAKQKIRDKRALQKPISKEAYAKRKLSGKNHWNWKGGISNNPESTYGKNWREIRMSVYKRDDYTCQKCGIKCSGKSGKNLIQSHHIEPYRKNKNNNINNLITLCLSCHIKEDFRHDKEMRDIKQVGGF